MCTWFGGAQQRSRTSDEYSFTLFDTSKNISKSTAYGNPCVEPSKIRQAFTCPVDNDSNWSIVVEIIPNEMSSRRKDIPRLNGSALECNMEMELEILALSKDVMILDWIE